MHEGVEIWLDFQGKHREVNRGTLLISAGSIPRPLGAKAG
jgi:hypothetical protein